MMGRWRRSLLVSAFITVLAQSAAAQDDNDPATDDTQTEMASSERLTPVERLVRTRDFLREKAQTRPRLLPPPIGRPPLRNDRAAVDWDEVRTTMAETSRRDAASANVTTAVVPRRPEGLRALAPERLQRVRPAEVDAVEMPILVPASSDVLASVQVFGQADAYSAIADTGDSVALRISGTRNRLVLENPPAPRVAMERMRSARPPLPGLGAQYVITRSDSSTDLSFSRFGCGYVLSLMCDDPDNARCAEDDFIVSLASSMVLLNENAESGQ